MYSIEMNPTNAYHHSTSEQGGEAARKLLLKDKNSDSDRGARSSCQLEMFNLSEPHSWFDATRGHPGPCSCGPSTGRFCSAPYPPGWDQASLELVPSSNLQFFGPRLSKTLVYAARGVTYML